MGHLITFEEEYRVDHLELVIVVGTEERQAVAVNQHTILNQDLLDVKEDAKDK